MFDITKKLSNTIRMLQIKNLVHETSSGIKNIPQLDGLRGIAILMVILVHLWANAAYQKGTGIPVLITLDMDNYDITKFFASASIGVYLFFVLSGFLLFLSYSIAIREKRDLPSFQNFYVRRILRIMPCFLFVFTIYIIFWQLLGPSPYSALVSKLSIISNIFFLTPLISLIYPLPSIDLIPGTWSLTPEMYFYLLLPILGFIVKKTRQFLPFLLIGILIGPFFRLYYSGNLNPLMYLPYHIDIFCFGVLAAWIYPVIFENQRFNNLIRFGGIIGVLLFLYTWIIPNPQLIIIDNRFQIGLSCFLILLGSLVNIPIISNLLTYPPLRLIGLISYSAFLINDIVFWYIMEPIFKLFDITNNSVRFIYLLVIGIPLVLTISFFLYIHVEKPFLKRIIDIRSAIINVGYMYIFCFIGIGFILFLSSLSGGLYK